MHAATIAKIVLSVNQISQLEYIIPHFTMYLMQTREGQKLIQVVHII